MLLQDVFDYIADHGLAGALEGAHVAPLMRIDEHRATALLVDRVAQVPPRVVVPALQAREHMTADELCERYQFVMSWCFDYPVPYATLISTGED